MTHPPLFLETTIQIERIVGSRSRQLALQTELANYQLFSSHYVLGEFLRTVVKDAVQLHRLLAAQTHLDDVLTAIGQHYNKKEASRMSLMLGAVMRIVSPATSVMPAREDLLDRLSLMLEFGLVNRFYAGIHTFVDEVQCGLATERPQTWNGSTAPSYHLRSQCVRTVRECALAEKMTLWQPQLEKIAVAFAPEKEPALRKMGELATKIIENPIIARGRNCTWYLGDLVIALELPPHIPLYTTNIRHFAPILHLLGKKLHTPKPNL